jgi:hypothetical protein
MEGDSGIKQFFRRASESSNMGGNDQKVDAAYLWLKINNFTKNSTSLFQQTGQPTFPRFDTLRSMQNIITWQGMEVVVVSTVQYICHQLSQTFYGYKFLLTHYRSSQCHQYRGFKSKDQAEGESITLSPMLSKSRKRMSWKSTYHFVHIKVYFTRQNIIVLLTLLFSFLRRFITNICQWPRVRRHLARSCRPHKCFSRRAGWRITSGGPVTFHY